jgi:hypothetical protein
MMILPKALGLQECRPRRATPAAAAGPPVCRLVQGDEWKLRELVSRDASMKKAARPNSSRSFSHPTALPSACGYYLVTALARHVQTRPIAALMEPFIGFSV